jgi:hypothetical protein
MRSTGVAAAPLVTLALLLTSPVSMGQTMSPENKDAELLRLEFDREKWRAETEMHARELALKEREQANKDADLALRRAEQARSRWTNPLVVAILVATLAALGNAVIAIVNGRLQRTLEDRKGRAELALEESKAESVRILEMIKTGDAETAAKNLTFLLDTGLVSGTPRAARLREFLTHRQPGTGPALPAPTRFSFERTEALTPSVQNELQKNLESYIAYLDTIGFPSGIRKAQVKIDTLDSPNAFYDGTTNTLVIDSRLINDIYPLLREYGHHMLMAQHPFAWSEQTQVTAIESGLADYFAGSFMNNPKVGEIAAKVLTPGQPYIRILANERKFSEFERLSNDRLPYTGAEIWGGAFWEMRTQYGRDAVDPILAQAWQSVQWPRSRADAARTFVDVVLATAKTKVEAGQVQAMREILERREFPVPQ